MKRLVIGDIHGHWDSLNKIYWTENPDEVIILGDYFDNFNGTDESILECFDNILALQKIHRRKNLGEFTLILGNHDYHYISGLERYSGYRRSYAGIVNTKLDREINVGNISVAKVDFINKTIYSHAGITNAWLNKFDYELEFINEINFNSLRFTYQGGGDMYGNTIYNSPIWVRPRSLLIDSYKKDGEVWTQIVGHTMVKQAVWCDTEDEDTNNKILLLDSMPRYYLVEELDNNKIIINRTIKKNENI